MKTMISMDGKRIWRTTNEKASELYAEGEANYVPKSEWKEKVRDKDVHESPIGTGFAHKDTKANKMSKAQKRQMRKANR